MLTTIFWGQSTRVPTYWNDTIPPQPPSSLLTFLQRHPEVYKPHASPSLSTNDAAGIACSSPVAGDFWLTSFPPLEYSQVKLGLTQHTLPSRKCPASGKVDRKQQSPLSLHKAIAPRKACTLFFLHPHGGGVALYQADAFLQEWAMISANQLS